MKETKRKGERKGKGKTKRKRGIDFSDFVIVQSASVAV